MSPGDLLQYSAFYKCKLPPCSTHTGKFDLGKYAIDYIPAVNDLKLNVMAH